MHRGLCPLGFGGRRVRVGVSVHVMNAGIRSSRSFPRRGERYFVLNSCNISSSNSYSSLCLVLTYQRSTETSPLWHWNSLQNGEVMVNDFSSPLWMLLFQAPLSIYFEYFCFLHPLLTWFYKCLQNKYPQLCPRCVKKAVCKAQEVFWGV